MRGASGGALLERWSTRGPLMPSLPTTPCPFGRPFRPGCWRRVGWLAVVMRTLVASGLPLPLGGLTDLTMAVGGEDVAAARLAAKDRSQPFPCQSKPCGCSSATQCFSSCCCHTPQELLAWARANGLEPAVLTALAHRVAAEDRAPDSPSPPATESQQQKSSCCATEPADPPGEASCCSADATPEREIPVTASEHQLPGSCCAGTTAASPSRSSPALPALHDPAEICSDYESLAATPPADPGSPETSAAAAKPDREPESGRRRTVVLSAMLACGGIASGWLSGGIAIVVPLHPAMTHAGLASTGTSVLVDESSPTVFAAPELPPPRGLAV